VDVRDAGNGHACDGCGAARGGIGLDRSDPAAGVDRDAYVAGPPAVGEGAVEEEVGYDDRV